MHADCPDSALNEPLGHAAHDAEELEPLLGLMYRPDMLGKQTGRQRVGRTLLHRADMQLEMLRLGLARRTLPGTSGSLKQKCCPCSG